MTAIFKFMIDETKKIEELDLPLASQTLMTQGGGDSPDLQR